MYKLFFVDLLIYILGFFTFLLSFQIQESHAIFSFAKEELVKEELVKEEKQEKEAEGKKEVFLERPDQLKNDNSSISLDSNLLDSKEIFYKLLFLILLFLVFFIFFILWLQKKKRSKPHLDMDHQAVKVLYRVSIGSSQFIQILDIGAKIYILGVSDHYISTINIIDHPDEIQQIKALCQKTSLSEKSLFRDLLSYYWKNGSGKSKKNISLFKSKRSQL